MSKQTFGGFTPPTSNFSPLPHQLIEAFPLFETKAEVLLVLYILRHTWGYHDDDKRITVDEFMHGRKRKDGTRLDKGTGMSKPSIIEGLRRAEEHGFISVETNGNDKARVKKFYRLKEESSFFTSEVKELYPGGKETLQRSEKETLEENSKKETSVVAHVADVEEAKPKTPDQLMFDAITDVWKTAPGFTGKLRKLLQAKFTASGNSKNDKRDAEWIENNLDKPMDAAEVRAFGAWYADGGDASLPEKPEKVANWIHRFRSDDQYALYMSMFGVEINTPDEPAPAEPTYTREQLGLPPMPEVDYSQFASMTPEERAAQIDALLDDLEREKGLPV